MFPPLETTIIRRDGKKSTFAERNVFTKEGTRDRKEEKTQDHPT